MKKPPLNVFADGVPAGMLERSDVEADTLLFGYHGDARPESAVSLTMPIRADQYDGRNRDAGEIGTEGIKFDQPCLLSRPPRRLTVRLGSVIGQYLFPPSLFRPAAGVLALLIAWLMVAGNTVKVATVRPVYSLRYE